VYPALAIAERLAERPDAPQLHFFASDRAVDAAILNEAKASFTALPVRPIPSRPWRLPGFLLAYWRSKRLARRRLEELEARCVVSTGGFVSGPVVAAAHAMGLRVILVNLDAVPGKANRHVARRCTQVFSVYPTPVFGRATPIGLPLRRAALAATDPGECRRWLGLEVDRPTLLITGASQGAGSLNDLMLELASRPGFASLFAARGQGAASGWQVLHLAGAGKAEALKREYDSRQVRAVVMDFCHQMGLAWGAADLAISRAGAGSVAEIAANGVPALFLPYPHHKDQHQRHNARPLVEAGAALMAEDRIDPRANADALLPLLTELMRSAEARRAMRDKLLAMRGGDGASIVADAAI
jgi:UDP-N-acetylglucosamine--N-acetylmuramyl-(pentapeptide) pyrophosphoryl-undecaprenol N-acetylglucosamine transferase